MRYAIVLITMSLATAAGDAQPSADPFDVPKKHAQRTPALIIASCSGATQADLECIRPSRTVWAGCWRSAPTPAPAAGPAGNAAGRLFCLVTRRQDWNLMDNIKLHRLFRSSGIRDTLSVTP